MPFCFPITLITVNLKLLTDTFPVNTFSDKKHLVLFFIQLQSTTDLLSKDTCTYNSVLGTKNNKNIGRIFTYTNS